MSDVVSLCGHYRTSHATGMFLSSDKMLYRALMPLIHPLMDTYVTRAISLIYLSEYLSPIGNYNVMNLFPAFLTKELLYCYHLCYSIKFKKSALWLGGDLLSAYHEPGLNILVYIYRIFKSILVNKVVQQGFTLSGGSPPYHRLPWICPNNAECWF